MFVFAMSASQVLAQNAVVEIRPASSNSSDSLLTSEPFSFFHRQEMSLANCKSALPAVKNATEKLNAELGAKNRKAIDSKFMLAQLYSSAGYPEEAFETMRQVFLLTLDLEGYRHPRTGAFASHLSEFAYFSGRQAIRRNAMRVAFALRNEILAAKYAFEEQQQPQSGVYANSPAESKIEHWIFSPVPSHSHTHLVPPVAWKSSSQALGADLKLAIQPKLRNGKPNPFLKFVEESLKTHDRLARHLEQEYRQDTVDLTLDTTLLLEKLSSFDLAAKLFQICRNECENQHGIDSLRYADVSHAYAISLSRRNEQQKAEPLLSIAHEITIKKSPGSVGAAIAQKNWVVSQIKSKKIDQKEAGRLLQESLTIVSGKLGRDHIEPIETRLALARLEAEAGNYSKALEEIAIANERESENALSQFLIFEHQDLIATKTLGGNGAIAIGMNHRASSKFGSEILDLQLSTKGNRFRTHRSLLDSVRNAQMPVPGALQVAEYASHLMTATPKIAFQNWNYVCARQGILKQATAKQLTIPMMARNILATKTQQQSASVKSESLQQQLSLNEAFVECVRYNDPWQNVQKYAAWLITRDKIEAIPFGNATNLEAQIHALTDEVNSSFARIQASDHEKAIEHWRQIAKPLSESLLAKITDRLPKKVDHLIISPDAALWNVPWAALNDSKDDFAIGKFEFDFVADAGGMSGLRHRPNFNGNSAIFHSPAFNATLPARKRDPRNISAVLNNSEYGLSLYPLAVAPLPGAAAEAKQAAASLRLLTGREADNYSGPAASEDSFMKLKSPKVLHLGTHGFFMPNKLVVSKSGIRRPWANPLTRCGLMLAGSNRRNTKPFDWDGVLSGKEVAAMGNLTDTELVVLSACETSVGEYGEVGEEFSLRSAFHLGGANAVLASLWNIPDLETAKLMASFYKNLAEDQNIGSAIRSAQLEMIDQLKKRHGAAHPIYWAAFSASFANCDAPPTSE